VQSHLLKDKGSVRLRRVLSDGGMEASSGSSNEQFVALEDLAWTIRDLSPDMNGGIEERTDDPDGPPNSSGSVRDQQLKGFKPSIDCIFVDNDQYFGSDKPIPKGDMPGWKAISKTMKSVLQRGESFISSLIDSSKQSSKDSLTVFAVADVPFLILREFGTSLMKRSKEHSATDACHETIEQYPKYKRVIKTLGGAIENYMKRRGFWVVGSNSQNQHVPHLDIIIFLYSKVDDRFDMVTLDSGRIDTGSNEPSKTGRRK